MPTFEIDLSGRRLYPEFPMVGVGALIKDGDRYLLIRRAAEPDAGLWAIPGGLVEVGERTEDAVIREVEEETGLKVEVVDLLEIIDKVIMDEKERVKYHYVILDYLVTPVGGEARPSSDALEISWVREQEFPSYELTPSLVVFLKRIGLYPE